MTRLDKLIIALNVATVLVFGIVLVAVDRLDRDLRNAESRINNIRLTTEQIERDITELSEPRPPRPRQDSPPSEAVLRGEASVYSRAGCLGCNPERITASGEKLDDA